MASLGSERNNVENCGCSCSAVASENIEKSQKMCRIVLADRKVKLCEIVDTLRISEGSVLPILGEHFSTKSLCSKWLQRLLAFRQK